MNTNLTYDLKHGIRRDVQRSLAPALPRLHSRSACYGAAPRPGAATGQGRLLLWLEQAPFVLGTLAALALAWLA